MFDRLTAALGEVEAALGDLDPNDLIGTQPATGIELLVGHERRVAAARTRLTARASGMQFWARMGYRSFEDWLAATYGTSMGRARDKTRAAKNLRDHDKTADALADGDISEEEADIIADAADKNPDAEADLLDTAKNKGKSNKDLKDKAADAKASGETDQQRSRRLRRDRKANWNTDRHGHWTLFAKLEPHIGAEMRSALDAQVDRIFNHARKAGTRHTLDQYRADALAALICGHHPQTSTTTASHNSQSSRTAGAGSPNPDHDERPDAHGDRDRKTEPSLFDDGNEATRDPDRDTTSSGGLGDPEDSSEPASAGAGSPATTGTRPPDSPPAVADAPTGPARRPGKDLTLDINLEAYRRRHVLSGETCHIRGIGPVPVEIARQWANDAFITAIIRDGTDIKKVVHYGRHIPATLRTALDFSSSRCAVPRCDNPRIEYHHKQPHHLGGACSWENLGWPCAFHHDQISNDGHQLTGQAGDWKWLDPDGTVLLQDNPSQAP